MKKLTRINILSFGFKHGAPPEANLLFDVRFLSNPFYEAALRALTGTDEPVAKFVLCQAAAQSFLSALKGLLAEALAGYVAHGHDHDAGRG